MCILSEEYQVVNIMFRTLLATMAVASSSCSTTTLQFVTPSSPAAAARKHLIVGTEDLLLSDAAKELLPAGLPFSRWKYLVQLAADGGSNGASSNWMFTGADRKPSTIVCAVLPKACSRHNSPIRPHAIFTHCRASAQASTDVLVLLESASHAAGTACAIGRAFPLFSAKTSRGRDTGGVPQTVCVSFATRAGPVANDGTLAGCAAAAAAVRRAARLVDLPPDLLTTTAFVEEARGVASRLGAIGRDISIDVLSGPELRKAGYGYLWNVGKAAEHPPALVVLSHVPAAAAGERAGVDAVCLVGKGITYDTGGLSLKTKEGMPGMKSDMGGAAALLAGFEAAVELGTDGRTLHLILCLAENAIGPGALRNDDIITGLAGLSCEINNADAEGRLVLADGVAHATAAPEPRLRGLREGEQPALVVTMATLTGAQLVATGKRHAAIVSNLESLEQAAVEAGRLSGDTCHPLPFAPELFRDEFASKIADLKNSVADRNNAQSACAASFVYEHLHPSYKGGWLHVDLAGPAWLEERGTGYGVGLLLGLLQVEGFRAMGRDVRDGGKIW